MPSSQLKRLKSSLREQGVIGPQQSKKQKRRLAQDRTANNEKRLQRSAALENIREQFNPFDLKFNARGPKFDVVTNRPLTGAAAKGIRGRPGVSKSFAEEKRRRAVLAELQSRHKVGGLLDRRYGERNPALDHQQKTLERFARDKKRTHKSSAFNLEDGEPGEELTHMGRPLVLDGPEIVDDFDAEDIGGLDGGSDGSVDGKRPPKRSWALLAGATDDGDELADGPGQPERKKSKREILEEVMSKSKRYRAERQADKEVDQGLRAELDKELPEIQAMLVGDHRVSATLARNMSSLSLIAGVEKSAFEKDFDQRVRQLGNDQRSRPAERTKTLEELAREHSENLKELEEARIRRMAGQVSPDGGGDDDDDPARMPESNGHWDENGVIQAVGEDEEGEDSNFGLGRGIRARPTATELGLDDEDDFLIEEGLVASGSELEDFGESDYEQESGEEGGGEANEDEWELEDGEDDEFTAGLLAEARAQGIDTERPAPPPAAAAAAAADADGVPLGFPCPKSSSEFIELTRKYPAESIPTIVRRIRTAYHQRLHGNHKELLGRFSAALVDYVSRDGGSDGEDDPPLPPFAILESLIRHIHSLAKTYPVEIAIRFRARIEEIGRDRPLAPHVGDLVMLTAVGGIYPTSDHFHQVVTPAMLTIGRFLGQKVPRTPADFATSAYLCTLAIQYQQLAKRYVPELMNSCLNALLALAPVGAGAGKRLGDFPMHESPPGIRIANARDTPVRRPNIRDCRSAAAAAASAPAEDSLSCRVAVLDASVRILEAAAETWVGKSSFFETFSPALRVLGLLDTKESRAHLPAALSRQVERTRAMISRLLQSARLSRRPPELHHHRPLAIKTFVPKFEMGFDPDKHYDPDRVRAETNRLRKEYKSERKGVMRELRRGARSVASEKLRIKKARDEAYERKHSRIVAEIRNEAGRDANEYAREKKARQRSNKRK